MPKRTSGVAHSDPYRDLEQMKLAFPILNGDSSTDMNVDVCNLKFVIDQPDPSLLTEASVDAGTQIPVTIRATIGDDYQQCHWFNGYVGYSTAGSSGTVAIDNAGDHVVFTNGVGQLLLTPSGAWSPGNSIICGFATSESIAGDALDNNNIISIAAVTLTVTA